MPEQNLCLFSSECREGYRSASVHSEERVTKGIIYDVHLPESGDSCLFFHLSIPQTESFQGLIQVSFSVLTGQKVHCPEITTLTLQFKDWSLLLIETKLCGPWKNTGQ